MLENKIGKAILNAYKSNQILDKNQRTSLVHMIIDASIQHRDVLHNSDLNVLASKRVEVFPNENKGTYYIPPGENKKLSNGKLVDRYRNARRMLKVNDSFSSMTPSFSMTPRRNVVL